MNKDGLLADTRLCEKTSKQNKELLIRCVASHEYLRKNNFTDTDSKTDLYTAVHRHRAGGYYFAQISEILLWGLKMNLVSPQTRLLGLTPSPHCAGEIGKRSFIYG